MGSKIFAVGFTYSVAIVAHQLQFAATLISLCDYS